MDIYEPNEDSFLIKDVLINYLENKKRILKILDMGSGSGILIETCRKHGFYNICACDINIKAVDKLRKLGFRAIKSDLFSGINEKFDLIIFNPPYLPLDIKEPKNSRLSTTGGIKGNELILKFLTQAKDFLNLKGSIILLFSSLSQPKDILNLIKKLKFKKILLIKKRFFFEEIYVYQLTLN